MYKMMIADDEPKIRNGLRKMLDYSQFGIEIIGEAEDGEIALREVTSKQPDILFLDICMPFLNGLELVNKLKENADCIIIIITGYDQFEYMQEAIKLQVFDYLLKPVSRTDLADTVRRVCGELKKRKSRNNYFKWVDDRIHENIDVVRNKFFQDLIKTGMDEEQIKNGLNYFKIRFPERIGIALLKIARRSGFENDPYSLDGSLLLYGIKNMTGELNEPNGSFCFFDLAENVVIISSTPEMNRWSAFCSHMGAYVGKYINNNVIYEYDVVNSLADLPEAYRKLFRQIKIKSCYKPITSSILQYIEGNFYDSNFSLEKTADKFKITPSYLSKLLKSETGFSFVDVLTNMRVQKAITLMDTSSLKIYEIAELVGYNNQYYFSRSFKKVTGISPVQYKGGKNF